MFKSAHLVKQLFVIVFLVISAYSIAAGNANDTLAFTKLKFSNIGKTTIPGTYKIDKNELEIKAGGNDIWGKHDEFGFEYIKLNGNFDFSVQIKCLSAVNIYTKAGIMARAALNDSSQHVFFQVFPDNRARNKNNGGCEFQYRIEAGANMKAIYPDLKMTGSSFDVTFPNTWIRLKRTDDIYTSYFSTDNKTWKQYSTFTLKMPLELYVGLAVTAHTAANYTTARFKSIQLSQPKAQ